jgi:hypothetical protein
VVDLMIEAWKAEDEDGVVCVLERGPKNTWYISMVEGPFSGYPTIAIPRSELLKLYHAIGNELMGTQLILNVETGKQET